MKRPIPSLNRWLDELEFSKKTRMLVVIISLGMISIGGLMLVSIFSIKYDYETLYGQRTIPQVHLENMKDIYSVNIDETLREISERSVDPEDAAEVLESALEIAGRQWSAYRKSIGGRPEGASHYAHALLATLFYKSGEKSDRNYYRKELPRKIQERHEQIAKQTRHLIETLRRSEQPDSDLLHSLSSNLQSANIYLTGLIAEHLKEAIKEKRMNDRLFERSIVMLTILIVLVFILSILITILLVNHFKKLNESLESKVALKTRELIELNRSLERRIEREVQNSRKKDWVMFQQAKMASLGEMLQNIAHQWRQPLGTMTMIIQGIEAKYLAGKLDERLLEEKVSDAMKIARNMSETLEDFRTFFHPHKRYDRFDLRTAILKALDLTRYQLDREGIEVMFEMRHSLTIYGYENELVHVLLNLINNARDALKERGVTEGKIAIYVKPSFRRVSISVIDNAGGVPKEILPKIFEPYFTTKYKGAGTGIGLYMSKQLIEKHMEGRIYVKNIRHKLGVKGGKMQRCAMFVIELPRTPKHPKEFNHETI